MLIDKDNRLVGGNKAQKGFKAAGKKKVIIVDSDADTLVAVRRKDVSLDSAEGRKMAYLDNLTTQVNLTWDETELEAVQADVEGFDIADFGFDIEDLPQVTFPTGEKQGEGDEGEGWRGVAVGRTPSDVWRLHRCRCRGKADERGKGGHCFHVTTIQHGSHADVGQVPEPSNAQRTGLQLIRR